MSFSISSDAFAAAQATSDILRVNVNFQETAQLEALGIENIIDLEVNEQQMEIITTDVAHNNHDQLFEPVPLLDRLSKGTAQAEEFVLNQR